MRCCVRGCQIDSLDTSHSKTITFHPFPSQETYRSAWLRALGKAKWQFKDNEKVCSEHFNKNDLYLTRSGLRKVKAGAVPKCILKATSDEKHVQSQLSKICRLCLNIKCNLVSITKYKLEDVFQNLTGLHVNLEDGLPYMLCGICAHKLQKYDLFKRSCIETNKIMIELLKNSDNVSILESIKNTNYKNELQILTKMNSFDLIITEFDDQQTNIDDNAEQDNFDNYDEDLIYVVENENLDAENVISENILTLEYENSDAENDKKNNSTVEYENSDAENDKENNLTVEYENSDAENDNENNSTVEYENSDTENDNENNSTVENNSDIEYQFDSDASLPIDQIREQKKAVEKTKQIEKKKEIEPEKDKPNTDLKEEFFTVTILTIEEQIADVENRKLTDNYRNAAFKCEICYKGFYNPSSYKNHMFRHSDDCGQYECDICKIRFDKFKAVRPHKMAAHIHKFSCKKCKFVTTCTDTAKSHEKWHKGTKYSCPHCTEVFDKVTSYMSHVRIKHPSDFVCGLCGYSFISAKGREFHKKIKHRGDDQVIPPDGPHCVPCNVRFATDEAYRKHLSISPRHENKDNKVRNEPLIKRMALKRKISDESVEIKRKTRKRKIMKFKEYIPCEQCGLRLEDFRAYDKHFRKMHPEKNRTKFPSTRPPCMCEVCGKIFQYERELKNHRMLHTGERPFKCEKCGKSFQLKICLDSHKEVHAAASHPCELCGKLFKYYCNMKRHMKYVHTDLKPFKCELCGKDFKSMTLKRAHVDYVHLKKPWPKRNRNRRKTQPVSQTASESL